MAPAAANEAAASAERVRAKTNFMMWSFREGGKEGNAANSLRINAIMKRDFSKGTNGVFRFPSGVALAGFVEVAAAEQAQF